MCIRDRPYSLIWKWRDVRESSDEDGGQVISRSPAREMFEMHARERNNNQYDLDYTVERSLFYNMFFLAS